MPVPAIRHAAGRGPPYYVLGRSQAEIAEWAPVARTSRACSPRRRNRASWRSGSTTRRAASTKLEDELRATFGLRDVRVAHAASGPGLPGRGQVGTQAARLLLDNVKDSMTVALSWGHALQSMVRHDLRPGVPRPQPRAAGGGLSSISNEISGQELVRGSPYASTRSTASCTRRRRSSPPAPRRTAGGAVHRGRAAEASRADLAFVGIGTAELVGGDPRRDTSTPRNRARSGPPSRSATSPPATTTPRASRSTAWSRPDPGDQPRRAAPDPQRRRGRPGPGEAPGVLGALRGHIIDSLVCDDTLARSLLSEAHTFPNDTGGI